MVPSGGEAALFMLFRAGQTIGGYEFLEELEARGAGLSYKVRNHAAGRLEVLKVLSREFRDDRERVERFLREVKIHELLSHPNLASFYRAFEIEGQMVMTLEFVDGKPLADRIKRGSLPIDKAVDYAAQALSALVHAHASGVMHRNITPSCLMVTPSGTIKVTDFELAKANHRSAPNADRHRAWSDVLHRPRTGEGRNGP